MSTIIRIYFCFFDNLYDTSVHLSDKRHAEAFHDDKVKADGIAELLLCLAAVAGADHKMADQILRVVLGEIVERGIGRIDPRLDAVNAGVRAVDRIFIAVIAFFGNIAKASRIGFGRRVAAVVQIGQGTVPVDRKGGAAITAAARIKLLSGYLTENVRAIFRLPIGAVCAAGAVEIGDRLFLCHALALRKIDRGNVRRAG